MASTLTFPFSTTTMWLKSIIASLLLVGMNVAAANSTFKCAADGKPGLLIAEKYAVASYPLVLSNETSTENLLPIIRSQKMATELEHNSTAKFQLFKCHQKDVSPNLNSTFWKIRHTSSDLCVAMKAPPRKHPKGSIGFQLRTFENKMVAKNCAEPKDKAFYDQVFYEQDNLHLVQYNALKNETRRAPRFKGRGVYLVQQLNDWESKHDYYLYFSVPHKA